MRKMQQFSVLLVAAALIVGLAGCSTDDDGSPEGGGGGDVSFQSFSPPSIYVGNTTNQRLVAFKGSLTPNTLISGIPAYASQHGLRRDPALFSQNDAFVLLLVTEADYNANKNNVGALESKMFARVFAFYNHTGTNNNVFEISNRIGGNGRLTIVNDTGYNVEFRDGGPTGPILGYAAARMTSGNNIFLDSPRDYEIYPIFKFFNPVDKELYSTVPKFLTGNLANKAFFQPFAFNDSDPYHTFNVNSIQAAGSFNLSSGGVYIRLINNSAIAVRMWDGTTPRYSTTEGNEYVNSQREALYWVEFLRGNDGTYPASRTLQYLRIGAGSNMLLVDSETYLLDYEYTITVTGANASDLAVGVPTSSGKLDLDEMFGLN